MPRGARLIDPVPSVLESLDRSLELRLRDQDVVGVERRDDEDRHFRIVEWGRERRQDTDLAKVECPSNAQGFPPSLGLPVLFDEFFVADDGELFTRLSDGEKRGSLELRGEERVPFEANDGESRRERE